MRLRLHENVEGAGAKVVLGRVASLGNASESEVGLPHRVLPAAVSGDPAGAVI